MRGKNLEDPSIKPYLIGISMSGYEEKNTTAKLKSK